MVKQGDIIKIDFNPQVGHEQAGYRSALVVSNTFYNKKTGLAILCPITNADNKFPLHVKLDDRTKTTGAVLCEHVNSLDVEQRKYIKVESMPKDILQKVINVVFAEIE